MSAALAVARREVHERRFLIVVAAVASAVSLVLQFVPRWALAHDLGEDLAFVLFLAFPLAAALAVGSSIVGRDVAEGRLSFYFSRPLTASALWAGKFLGGAALVVAAFVCCFVPLWTSMGVAQGKRLSTINDLRELGFLFLGLLCVMCLAHVAATMYRSRSRLLALDLGLAALFAALLGAEVRHLVNSGAGSALLMALPFALAGVSLAILAAAAAQLAVGRADVRRGHAALSATLWSLAAAGLLALLLWGGWVLRVTPADLGGVGRPVFTPPRGDALVFLGASWPGRAGYNPAFVMDAASGAYVRFPAWRLTEPAFDREGTTAVWLARPAPWFGGDHPRLAVARFAGGPPAIDERRLDDSEPWGGALALDTARRQVLVSSRSAAGIVDLDAGTLLSHTALPEVTAGDLRADGIVRLYAREGLGSPSSAFVVTDWNPRDGSRTEKVRIGGALWFFLLARRGDVAVVGMGDKRVGLVDTGAGKVRTFDLETAQGPGAALVLSSGQVVLTLGREVRIVTPEGVTVATIPVDAQSRVYGLVEPAADELAIGLWSRSLDHQRTKFVDVATATVRGEEKDVLPARAGWGGATWPAEPGSLGSRLFLDADGALLALEPGGRRRAIVSPRE